MSCSDFCYKKRVQTVDLAGKVGMCEKGGKGEGEGEGRGRGREGRGRGRGE
jgi:hypothetical protein